MVLNGGSSNDKSVVNSGREASFSGMVILMPERACLRRSLTGPRWKLFLPIDNWSAGCVNQQDVVARAVICTTYRLSPSGLKVSRSTPDYHQQAPQLKFGAIEWSTKRASVQANTGALVPWVYRLFLFVGVVGLVGLRETGATFTPGAAALVFSSGTGAGAVSPLSPFGP